MAETDDLHIQAAVLEDFVARIFRAAGCSAAEAGRVAHYLLAANLTGHDSHGVVRVPRYVEALATGAVFADREVETVLENDAMAVLDGRMGLGQTVTPQAVERGVAKALRAGAAVIALRNAGHIGRVGDWTELAASRGVISIHFVNGYSSLLVAPFGGAERRFSTAPFCVGVPRAGQDPVVLDFATSLVAEGKVLVASNGGKPIPDDALIGPDGAMSGDPRLLYGEIADTDRRDARRGPGAIRAFGGHKGSGLALICELLGGLLTGNGAAGPATPEAPGQPRRFRNGMLSIYLAPSHFGSAAEFDAAATSYVEFVRSARPAVPGGAVMTPGEPEARTRAARLAAGVPMPRVAWAAILAAAARLGVAPP